LLLLVDSSSAANAGPEIAFASCYDTNGGNTITGAAIKSYKVPAAGSGSDQYEHGLIFKTSNYTTGIAERARITSDGYLLVGTTSTAVWNGAPGTRLIVGGANNTIVSAQSSSTSVDQGAIFEGLSSAVTSGSQALGSIAFLRSNTSTTACSSYAAFYTNNAGTVSERARITSGGLFFVNTTTSSGFGDGHRIFLDVAENTTILSVDGGTEFSAQFRDVTGGGYSTAGTAIIVGKNSSTSRSINAGGTVNASGADYAEYMEKAGEFVIAKGDVCGIDADGKLTNVYANAVAFVVKSTNPSYVGGDSWGAGYKDDPEGLEAARQKVDRIAFSGQVPVNVLGAVPGQYIVPVNDNGAIKGVAVSNPSFEQYQTAVGKVIAIEDDGRARIIVKIA